MGAKFVDWFFDWLCDLWEIVQAAAQKGFVLLVTIITFPIWIFPFLYWYFTEWGGGGDIDG